MQCYTILYTRKSSEEDDRQALSLDAQEVECLEYAARHDLAVNDVIREAHSARKPGRPQFEAMLQRIRSLQRRRTAVQILCHKPDRLLRNIGDWAKINDLMESGVTFSFVSGSYPNNAQGKLTFGVNVLFAKYYVDNLSEEVKKGLREKIRRGEWPGPAPLGYRNQDQKLVVDPAVAPLIRQAFIYYASGEHSLTTLANQLYAEGLRGRFYGGMVSRSTLAEQVLANPIYCGMLRFKGALYAGSHEPIISVALYERVQTILRERAHPRHRQHDFRYTGTFTCAACGAAVVGDVKKGRYIYYRCSHKRGYCAEGYVREEALQKVLRSSLAGTLVLNARTQTALREVGEQMANEASRGLDSDLLRSLQATLAESDTKLGRLLDLRLANSITEAEYLVKREEIVLAQAQAKERIAALELRRPDPKAAITRFVYWCNHLADVVVSAKNDELREILRIVGSNYRWGGKAVTFEPVTPFTIASQAQNCPTWLPTPDDIRTICELTERLKPFPHSLTDPAR